MNRTLPTIKLPRSASRRAVVGLDIEPGAVRAVQARSERGRLVVETTASAVLDPGVIRDGEVVDAEALATSLQELFAAHKLDRNVRLGVANQRIVVRHMLLPAISDSKELATAIRFMAAEELPMPIDQAVLDHHILGEVDTPQGPRTRVLVVAARRGMIETLLSSVRAAGLRPQGIDLSAFAMVRGLHGHAEGTVLHVGLGGIVNLAVTHGGECLFTRVIGGGIESMAVEVAERAGVTIGEARDAVMGGELADPVAEADAPAEPDELTRLTRSVMADGLRRIAGEVRNSLDFHLRAQPVLQHGGAEGAEVERVLLTGSAVGVRGLADQLGSMLSLPVETPGLEGVDDADRGHFAVAAGLCVEEMAA